MGLIDIVEHFKDKKILVVGDVMLDVMYYGQMKGASPEGAFLDIEHTGEDFFLGGAGNAANNVASLDAKTYICGVVGKDFRRGTLLDVLSKGKINTESIFEDGTRPTTQKIKYIVKGAHYRDWPVLKISKEKRHPINKEIIKKVRNRFLDYEGQFDAVIVSDYAKGFVVEGILNGLYRLSKENLTVVDTKPERIGLFSSGFRFFTPNEIEVGKITGLKYNGLDDRERLLQIGKELSRKFDYENVVMTCGRDGMVVYSRGGNDFTHIPAVKTKQEYDVSGAGDTVAANLALALSSGADIYDACAIAAHAASIVVGKTGTATCSKKELIDSLRNNYR